MSNDPVPRHSFKTLDKLVDFEKHLKINEKYFEFVSIISNYCCVVFKGDFTFFKVRFICTITNDAVV